MNATHLKATIYRADGNNTLKPACSAKTGQLATDTAQVTCKGCLKTQAFQRAVSVQANAKAWLAVEHAVLGMDVCVHCACRFDAPEGRKLPICDNCL